MGNQAIEGRLSVVIDTDTVHDSDDDQTEYLIGLLRREEFKTYRYADGGPPPENVRHVPDLEISYGVGWLLFEPGTDSVFGVQGRVSYCADGENYVSSNVRGGDILNVAAHFASARQPDSDHRQVRRDITALLIAEAASAPLLVTRRQTLLDPPSEAWPDACQACDVETAVIMVGLWLRAKGAYVYYADDAGMALTDRHTFYAVLASDLVPANWRWADGCSQSGDPALFDLAISLRKRLTSALKSRDRAHTVGYFMTEHAAEDEVLECVDTVALYLMSTFDIAARVANQVLEIDCKPQHAAWQDERWVKRLPSPGLRDHVTVHKRTLEIVRMLRNTIHHKAMHLGVIEDRRPGDSSCYVVLPAAGADSSLEEAMRVTGGLAAWGVRETAPGQLWADPFVLIEQLIIQASRVLDELLKATPVERLTRQGVALQTTPPCSPSIWDESNRRRIRWQFGGILGQRCEEANETC